MVKKNVSTLFVNIYIYIYWRVGKYISTKKSRIASLACAFDLTQCHYLDFTRILFSKQRSKEPLLIIVIFYVQNIVNIYDNSNIVYRIIVKFYDNSSGAYFVVFIT